MEDRLPYKLSKMSCVSSYSCVIEFSQSVSECLCLCVYVCVSFSVSLTFPFFVCCCILPFPHLLSDLKELCCRCLVMFQALLNGIDSVNKVLQSFRDQNRYPEVVAGYHGIMIEVFDCEKTFFTCVEVTAGTRWAFLSLLLCCAVCLLLSCVWH